jgi:hypothetical protein
MLLLIIGLHFVLGSIWLINNEHIPLGILCFGAGMAATHFGWKKFTSRKAENEDDQ